MDERSGLKFNSDRFPSRENQERTNRKIFDNAVSISLVCRFDENHV